MLMIPEETVINIAIFWKTTPFSDTSSWLDPFHVCLVEKQISSGNQAWFAGKSPNKVG
jgi:hypothetical protein